MPPGSDDPIAAIDVGTNTTLLLIARNNRPHSAVAADPEVLADAAEITRLGRGIGADARLGRAGIAATLAALARYAETVSRHGASLVAVGTEALRRATNAEEFLAPAREILGTPIQVISGDREAALTFRAVAESFPAEVARGRVAVVDIGGGSTEVIVSEAGRVVFRRSLPLGSVRLHERHVHGDPPSAGDRAGIEGEIAERLEDAREAFAGEPFTVMVGVAGTVTSLAAMTLRLATYDSARVHGSALSLADLDAQIARLETATQAQRQMMVGLDPKRADVIFAGAVLLRALARRAGVDVVRVSDRGIRWGLFYEQAAARGLNPNASGGASYP